MAGARDKVSSLWHSNKNRLSLLILCVVTVAGSYYALFDHYGQFNFDESDVIYKIESRLLDWKLTSRDKVENSGKVGILAIDDKAIKTFESYPLKRQYYAQAFANLKKRGVEWIGFDVIFDKPQEAKLSDAEDIVKNLQSPSNGERSKAAKEIENMFAMSPGDRELIAGVSGFQNIVLGYYLYLYPWEIQALPKGTKPFEGIENIESSEVLSDFPCEKENISECLRDYRSLIHAKGLQLNMPAIQQSSQHAAFFSNNADEDAINRWLTLVAEIDGKLYPSLALKTAAEYLNRDIVVFFDSVGIENISLISRDDETNEIRLPVDPQGQGRLLINHRGPGKSVFPHVSLADAYNDSFSDDQLKFLNGAVLLLGATAIGSNDIRPNPYDPSIDGVENHAAIIDNIIMKDWFKRPLQIYETELKIVLGIGLLFAPIMIFGRAILSGVAVILFMLGYFYFDKYVWFSEGTWAYMAVPFFEIIVMYFSTTLFKYVTEEKERQKVKGAFQFYLSPEVIDQVLQDPELLKTGGEKKTCTVYFSDVRGFTSISEKLKPEELSAYTNHYFTPMANRILATGGCLDKFIGDAIMAFWGAPLDMPDHPQVAAQTAVDHLFDLDKIRSDMEQMNFPPPQIGIGLNTGEMTVGNMGCDARFSYTVMGDSVNLGSRLEGLTKEYGIQIMISEATQKLLPEGQFFTRNLDDITVKGKIEPVKVFELMRPDALPKEQMIHDLLGHFHLGREAYIKQDWAKAEEYFMAALMVKADDGPTLKYLERVTYYKAAPPGQGWDGVYRFNHK